MIDVSRDPRFRVEQETIVIKGLQKPFRIMQLSDAHLSLDSPLDSDEVRQKAAHQREVWFSHGNGLSQEENFRLLTAYGRERDVDLFLYPGDMMDFPSVGTAAAAIELMNEAGDYVFAPGNHEYAERFDYYDAATDGSPAFHTRDCGEFVIVSVNNAAHTCPTDVLEKLRAVLYGDKPVILLEHTPIDCDTLHPAAVAYWQDPTYFLFGCPGGGENIEAFISLVTKEKTQLKAVICGHMHFDHVDVFENGVPQLISAPCLAGYARLITVKGE